MLFLNQDQVRDLLDLDELVEAIALAMVDLSAGRASLPNRTAALVKDRNALLGAMPGFCPTVGVLASKLVTLFPLNAGGPLPTHQAVIVVFDPENGRTLAFMDGTHITAVRTAAGSALATKLLARQDAKSLAVLGTGVQAWSHVRAVTRVRSFESIRIAGRDYDKTCQMSAQVSQELGISTKACRTWSEASKGADVVCATTHPHEPVVRREWLSSGTHVNSVGMSAEGREVDLDTIREAKTFVELRSAATSPMPTGSNDLFEAVRDGVIHHDSLTEVGELIMGVKDGRESATQITLYKSVGVAVQDAAAAALVLRRAITEGVGLEVQV